MRLINFFRPFLISVVAILVSLSTWAGLFEPLSRGAYFITHGTCQSYSDERAFEALGKADCAFAPLSIVPQSADFAKFSQQIEKDPEDKFFGLLAKQHSQELKCSADFAEAVSAGPPNALENLTIKIKLLRQAKQDLIAASAALDADKNIPNKVCPLHIDDLEVRPGDPSIEACRILISKRADYQTALDGIPLGNLPDVKNLLENYSNIKEGPEFNKLNAGLSEKIKEAFTLSKKLLNDQAQNMEVVLKKKGGAGFDRNARNALLSDPLVISKIIKDSGNSEDLKGLACRADARYGKGADSLNTGFMIGSLAIGGISSVAVKAGSVALKVAEGAQAARAAGYFTLNQMRMVQASVAIAQGVGSYEMIESACFNGAAPTLLTQQPDNKRNCVSAPKITQLSQDSCVLASTLSAVGLGGVARSVKMRELIAQLGKNTIASTTTVIKRAHSEFTLVNRGEKVSDLDVKVIKDSVHEIDDKLLKGGLDVPDEFNLDLRPNVTRSLNTDKNEISVRPARDEIAEASKRGIDVDGTVSVDHEYGHAIFHKNMERYSEVWSKKAKNVKANNLISKNVEQIEKDREIDQLFESLEDLRKQRRQEGISNQKYESLTKQIRETDKKMGEVIDSKQELHMLDQVDRQKYNLENEISTEYQELFSDLIPAAKRNNGADVGRAFKGAGSEAGGRGFAKRYKSPKKYPDDEHYTLDPVRNFVWNKYFTNPKNSDKFPQMLEKAHKAMAEEVIERAGTKELLRIKKPEKIRRLIDRLKNEMRDFE